MELGGRAESSPDGHLPDVLSLGLVVAGRRCKADSWL